MSVRARDQLALALACCSAHGMLIGLRKSALDAVRAIGTMEPIFYRWRKQFAGMGVGEIHRLKQLEEESAKLKRIMADLSACLRTSLEF